MFLRVELPMSVSALASGRLTSSTNYIGVTTTAQTFIANSSSPIIVGQHEGCYSTHKTSAEDRNKVRDPCPSRQPRNTLGRIR
jgi:hypothetical protein